MATLTGWLQDEAFFKKSSLWLKQSFSISTILWFATSRHVKSLMLGPLGNLESQHGQKYFAMHWSSSTSSSNIRSLHLCPLVSALMRRGRCTGGQWDRYERGASRPGRLLQTDQGLPTNWEPCRDGRAAMRWRLNCGKYQDLGCKFSIAGNRCPACTFRWFVWGYYPIDWRLTTW